jgi:hypothetical protein
MAMRTFMRRVAVAGAFVLAAGGVTVATAGTASASGWGCSGTEVASYPVKTPSGAVFSYAHLFWDSSTGYNCAVNVKVGSLNGVQSWTYVELDECTGDTPGYCNPVSPLHIDSGNFYNYAGPVRAYGQGHCIELEAITQDTAGNSATYGSNGGYHC